MHEENDRSSRRSFLSSSTLGALLPAVAFSRRQASEWSQEETANVRIVSDFCAAWSTLDMAAPLSFMSEDTVYRMSEATPAVNGHQGVRDRLQSFVEASDEVVFEVLETFAAGPIVINHRIDRFVSTTTPVTWEGVGVFFVRDGKIREWSDYTIRVGR